MISRSVTLTGYVVFIVVTVVVEIVARRSETVPTMDRLVRWILRTRSGRVALWAGWAWLGLHFLG